MMALLEDTKEVVVEQLSVNPDEVKEDAKFVEDQVLIALMLLNQ